MQTQRERRGERKEGRGEGGRRERVKKEERKQNLLYSECQNGNSLCKVLKNTNVIDLF